MSRKLVAYFSASGTTKKAAEELARAAEADIYEIEPEEPYTKADLNYMDSKSRSSLEMNDHSSRPAIKGTDAKAGDYDVIYLGFPIWWYTAPTIVNTFLEKYDMSGKTIVLFATSGGSGFGKAAADLKKSVAEDTVIKEGKVFRGRASGSDLEALAGMA